MIDASIPLQVRAPQIEDQGNALMRVLQMSQLMDERQKSRKSLDDENALNAAYSQALGADGKLDRNRLFSVLAGANQGRNIPGIQKQLLEADEKQAKIGKETADTDKVRSELVDASLKRSREFLDTVTTPEQYLAWHRANHADPVLGPVLAARGITPEQSMATIQQALQTPGGFQELMQKSALGMDKFTADLRAREGHAITMRGQDMTDARTREEGAANRSVTMRGQNLTDARSREANANGRVPAGYRQKADGSLEFIPGGPADPNAAKKAAPTEFQGKAGMFGTRAQEADRVITELEGKYSPAGINAKQSVGRTPLIGGGLEAAGNMALSDSSQKAEQAQRDFVNAVLRLESGAAIGKDEFENARRQYFTQPGDRPEVIAQKARNRKTAIQGLMNNARPGAAEPTNTGGATGDFGNGWSIQKVN